jgi:hypothetical protein
MNEYHGKLFGLNYELSYYSEDIEKSIQRMPLLMKFKLNDSIYSFKEKISATL